MNSQPQTLLTRLPLFAVAFFGILILLLYEIALLFILFLTPLIWAAIITLALYPLYRKLVVRLIGNRRLAAGIMTFITLLLLIGPAVTLLVILVAQSVGGYQWTSANVQTGRLAELRTQFWSSYLDRLLALPALARLDIKGMVVRSISDFSSGIAGQISGILKNSLALAVDIAIMLKAIFSLFSDNGAYHNTVIALFPFTPRHKDNTAEKFINTFTAVINGVFLFIAWPRSSGLRHARDTVRPPHCHIDRGVYPYFSWGVR